MIASSLNHTNRHTQHCDVCVIGGGLMGSAVALGLARQGAKVLMLDRLSAMQRASKANFGLIWSQSKGLGNVAYRRLSINAALAFREFGPRLEQETGIDMEMRLGAGLILAIGDKEREIRKNISTRIQRQDEQYGGIHSPRMVDRADIQAMIGTAMLGQDVRGGSFCDIDGDINPLLLLKAMRKAFLQQNGRFRQNCAIRLIRRKNHVWIIDTPYGPITTPRIVLAAGLGNIELAAGMGTAIPVMPQKGQLLVTERMAPFLPFPMSGIRQTDNGSVMIGYTQENTGFDVDTSTAATRQLAGRALSAFPGLSHAQVVRSWAGLRVLTKDGFPIYDTIDEHAFLLVTHSCVTLASLHASLLPPWILGGAKPDDIQSFDLERFHV